MTLLGNAFNVILHFHIVISVQTLNAHCVNQPTSFTWVPASINVHNIITSQTKNVQNASPPVSNA